MSQVPTDGKSLLDPFGVWKAARDANLEAWSKLMIDVVNSDEYSRATGIALEQILATSQPLRDSMERSMTQTLSMLNMPSRAEVISLAERLVNIEMRLDDLDAKITGVQKSIQDTVKKTVHDAMTAQNSRLKAIEAQVEPETMQATVKEAVRGAFAAQTTRIKGVETDLEAAIKETVRAAMTAPNNQLKSVDTQLQAVNTLLAELRTSMRANTQAQTEARANAQTQAETRANAQPRTEARAEVKAEPKPEPKPEPKAEVKPAQPTAKKEQEAK